MSSHSSPVPVLADGNYHEWKAALEEYLTPNDHVRVIRRTKSSMGALVDPVPPTDPDDLVRWNQSERIAMGVIASTAIDLHLELLYKYEYGSVWELWKAIEARHAPRDAFLYHQAWVHLFNLRKSPDERYVDYIGRVDDACIRIDRATPTSLTPEQLRKQLLLFSILTGLPSDDPLRSLIFQKNITLDDVRTVFLRTDTLARMYAQIEPAKAVPVQRCYRCDHPGHKDKDCPHSEAIDRLIAHRIKVSAGNRSGQRKGNRQSKRSE